MRVPKSISMEMETWQSLYEIARKENTNIGRLIENVMREKYKLNNPKRKKK